MRTVETRVDVTEAAGLGEPAAVAVSVFLPDAAPGAGHVGTAAPVVFAFPGGGYNRRYYDLPLDRRGVERAGGAGNGVGQAGGGGSADETHEAHETHEADRPYSQAAHHTARGLVVVACDHLGTGDSTQPSDPFALTLECLAAANDAAVDRVLQRLRDGSLADGVGPSTPSAVVGIGQSMGGAILSVHQGTSGTFDAVAFLGWSGIHSAFPDPGGDGRLALDVPRRGTDLRTAAFPAMPSPEQFRYCFHYDDVPDALVRRDLGGVPEDGMPPPWCSTTAPICAVSLLAPGVVAAEDAAIESPVLVACGERDVVPDPGSEPAAYPRAERVDVAAFPRMGHMHNFAGTRHLLWDRLVAWVADIAAPPAPGRDS